MCRIGIRRGDPGLYTVVMDITARKLAEKVLSESEERFRAIADSAPVPMWVSRLDGLRQFVNRAYHDFLGVPYADALNFDWRKALHPEDLARILGEQRAGEGSRKPFTLEARYRRHDGQWRWLRSESQPRWGPDGEHIGFIGVAHDITASKEAERALTELNETWSGELKIALGSWPLRKRSSRHFSTIPRNATPSSSKRAVGISGTQRSIRRLCGFTGRPERK